MEPIQNLAIELNKTNSLQQLTLLATTGQCWFDKLLLEIPEMNGNKHMINTLRCLAIEEMQTEEWHDLMKWVARGMELLAIEKADKVELLNMMREDML